MKKGFTLIEILAVMVIMAIIGAIAVPQMLKIIEESKLEIVSKNNNLLISTTKQYLMENRKEFPVEIGETKEITMEMLKENKNLNDIRNPLDKNETCNGYVLVTKIDEGNFDYTPHIKCGINIKNTEEDGLVAHYKFDDFQEPTINLLMSPEFSNNSLGSGWGSWEAGVLSFGKTVINGKTTNFTNVSKRSTNVTNAIHQAVTSIQTNQNYTLSFYIRINPNSDVSEGIIRAYINNYVNFSINKEWKRIELTQIATASSQTIHITQNSMNYDVQIAMVQLENKPYATPFKNGARESKVLDYSINNNISSLSQTLTPRWVYDEERNSGAYLFNNKIITIGTGNTFFPLNSFTMSAWIKTPGLGNGMSLNGILSITYGLTMSLNSSGNLNVRMDNQTSIQSISVSKPLHDNKFHHVLVTFDGTHQSIYIDGELMRKSEFSGWIGTTRWPTNSAVIGQENNNGPIYRFNGKIDDIRIYNRALSEQEVQYIYNSTK